MWKHKNFINLQLCATPPAKAVITVNWDSNITKVIGKGFVGIVEDYITFTNGQSVTSSVYDGIDYAFELTLNNGYALDTVTLSNSDPASGVLKSQDNTYFVITAGSGGIGQTITLTSKLVSTFKFKHLTSIGTIGIGTYKFRHYAQEQEKPQLATPTNLTADGTTISWDEVENAESYDVYADDIILLGNTTGSSVSKNWKFNGTKNNVPQIVGAENEPFEISGKSYDDATFYEDVGRFVYLASDKKYLAFGSAGSWNARDNTYGRANILKFNTEPSGELLVFLQTYAQPI